MSYRFPALDRFIPEEIFQYVLSQNTMILLDSMSPSSIFSHWIRFPNCSDSVNTGFTLSHFSRLFSPSCSSSLFFSLNESMLSK